MEKHLIQPAIAALLSFVIAVRAYKRKSLNLSGAVSGFIVMFIHLAVNYRFGAMLLVFFFTSSKFTKFGEDRKRKLDADFKEGGQRDWIQVLFNGGITTLLVLTSWKLIGSQDRCLDSKESRLITALIGGIIGQYCCCNGDTWSSELGILSNEEPRLITTFKPVRRGTNGGVTKAGLLAAAAAGSVIGLTFVVMGFFTTKCTSDVTVKQFFVIPLSALAGVCGSVIDSLLGATLQFSGFCTVRKKMMMCQSFLGFPEIIVLLFVDHSPSDEFWYHNNHDYLGDITLDKVPRSRRSDTVEWCSSKDKKFGIVTESSF